LKSLIAESEANGIWTLQAGMFPENENSIRLHQKERVQDSWDKGKNRENG